MRDAPALARLIYALAGAEPDHPPLATTLVEMALGPGSLMAARPGSLPCGVQGRLLEMPRPRPVGGAWPGSARWRVEVDRRLFHGACLPRLLALVAHELGEWGVVSVDGYRGQDIEAYADELGLMLRAPQAAVRRICAEAGGPDHQVVAEELLISEIEAAVRVADALSLPTLVLGTGYCWEAGPVYSWPSDLDLLAHLVSAGRLPRHVELIRVTGATILRATDAG